MAEPFYSPTRQAAVREPKPGQVLWTVRKDATSRRAELRYHGEWGVEFQLFADGRFMYGQRCPSRELAMAVADAELEARIEAGWTRVP